MRGALCGHDPSPANTFGPGPVRGVPCPCSGPLVRARSASRTARPRPGRRGATPSLPSPTAKAPINLSNARIFDKLITMRTPLDSPFSPGSDTVPHVWAG
ncbi:MAG: hypothetical protein D8B55_00700, partial [Actinomyces sp.]